MVGPQKKRTKSHNTKCLKAHEEEYEKQKENSAAFGSVVPAAPAECPWGSHAAAACRRPSWRSSPARSRT